MKPLKSKTKKAAASFNDKIILPFLDNQEDDIQQLIKEMEEESRLALTNASEVVKREIGFLNRLPFDTLSKVA